jgi:hypothetical protein
MSESASYISFCNGKATAREISSPPGVGLTIPFPLSFHFPFPSSVAFPFTFPFPSVVPFPFMVLFSLPWVSSSSSLSSLSLPSPEQILPPFGPLGSDLFSSSSSSSIISFQFRGVTARKSPHLICRPLGGSIFALRSSLPYQEKRTPVCLNFPELVICRFE